MNNAFERIVDKLSKHQHDTGKPVDSMVRGLLASGIRNGAKTAIDEIRKTGKALAYEALGINDQWRELSLKNNSIVKDMMQQELKDDIQKVVDEEVKTLRESGKLGLTKKLRAELAADARRHYMEQVEHQVKRLMRTDLEAKAKKDVEDVYRNLPVLLEEGKTLDDVLADQFTQMMCDDDGYEGHMDKRNGKAAFIEMMEIYSGSQDTAWLEYADRIYEIAEEAGIDISHIDRPSYEGN